jgi:hypothetical protein
MKTFKEYIQELRVRDGSGKLINVPNVKIRMADGTLKSLPPGKSGSSGGGGAGGDGGGD